MLKFVITAILLLCSGAGAAQKEVSERKAKAPEPPPENKTDIVINYNEDTEASEESFHSGEEGLFDSPALASGLVLGSNAINQSIDTLLEQVFYSLLDRKLSYDITDDSQFTFKTHRDVFPTLRGSYVVVDRFGLGPEYSKVLSKVSGMPISLGADGKVNIFNIYLRSDGMRLYEQQELPFWRVMLNNWVGVLPVLTLILPPSFNPNELYDPVTLVETPFTFPVTVGGFRTMPVGSIRSYNISGGVNLPIDIAGALPKKARDALQKAENLKAKLPYSIFVEGEYRINVLRRTRNIAWVGLTTVKRFGNRISSELGTAFDVLAKVSPYWGGIPVKLLPLNLEYVKAKARLFNQLYEFDLDNRYGREAYRKAVGGDFVLANQRHLERKDKNLNTGVKFHFQKTADAWEGESDHAPNLVILSKARKNKRSEAEIEFIDEEGKFYILEGKQDTSDAFAEVLTGKQQTRYNHMVAMKVVKVADPQDPDKYTFAFPEGDPEPYVVTLAQKIYDRYVDSQEYREYIGNLRFFTKLSLADVPNIPRRDPEQLADRRKVVSTINPDRDAFALHVTPTYLGRFSASAAMVFKAAEFDKILATSDDKKWAAFAAAFGLSRSYWGVRESRDSVSASLRWFEPALNYPLGLFNMRIPVFDFIAEARGAVNALQVIAQAQTPLEKLNGFYALFDNHNPDKLARALLNLANLHDIPRSVSFHTNAKGPASKEVKRIFKDLNNRVIRSVKEFPPLERARVSEEKLEAFNPGSVREIGKPPFISKINVSAVPLPKAFLRNVYSKPELVEEIGDENLNRDQIYLQLFVKNLPEGEGLKLYVRVEQAGRLTLGKFVLGEKVIELKALDKKTVDSAFDNAKIFEFFLTGPLSPLNTSFFANAIDFGGEFAVTMTASTNSQNWSEERTFRFGYDNGTLLPVNDKEM